MTKSGFITGLLLTAAGILGCNKSSFCGFTADPADIILFHFPRDTFELSPDQLATLALDPDISIRFEEVVADSRCPLTADGMMVQCFVPGTADVKITLSTAAATNTDTLYHLLSNLPNTTTWAGLNLELIGVSPYPVVNQVIPPEDYRVRFVVWE